MTMSLVRAAASLCCWSAALVLAAAAAPVPAVTQIDELPMLARVGRGLAHNTLKLLHLAVDERRGRIFVSGSTTPHVAIVDSVSGRLLGSVDTGIYGFAQKMLGYDAVADRLYVRESASHTLRAIQVATGQRTGPVAVPTVVGSVVADAQRGRVYLVTGEAPGLRAYDGATLALTHGVSSLGTTLVSARLAGTQTLLLLDAALPASVKTIDLDSGATGSIGLALPPGIAPSAMDYDAARNTVWVRGGGTVLGVAGPGAAAAEKARFSLQAGLNFQDLAVDSRTGHVALLQQPAAPAGQVAPRGAVLRVHNAAGQFQREIAFGAKPHRLVYDGVSGLFQVPDADGAHLWRLNGQVSGSAAVGGVRIGDSAEQVLFSPDGGTVFTNSRLGGSYLAAWQPASDGFQSFSAGTWPIPMRIDAVAQQLVVFNFWDSTLSLFDLAPLQAGLHPGAGTTIGLGVAKGSTDRLGHMALDTQRRRAYAALPELGQIAVADLSSRTALAPIAVSGMTAGDDGAGGAGQLQLLVHESAGLLYAFDYAPKRLLVYNLNGASPALAASVNLPGLGGMASALDHLVLDASGGRLYVGPLEVDALTGQPTGRRMGAGDKLVGRTAAGWWSAGSAAAGDGTVANTLYRLNAASLAVEASHPLADSNGFSPEFAFDPVHERLAMNDLAGAVLRLYSLNDEPNRLMARIAGQGPYDRWTARVQLEPAAADRGRPGKVVVGAQLGSEWYLLGAQGWQLYTGGALTAYPTAGTVPALLDIPLAEAMDVSGLAGLRLYVGAGRDDAAILDGAKRLFFVGP